MDSITALVTEKKNLFYEGLRLCRNTCLDTYVYGAGEGADNVIRRASSLGFQISGKLVDKEYYSPNTECKCLEEVLATRRINLVVAHRGFDKNKLSKLKKNIEILLDVDCFSGNYEADPEIMTWEFVKEHEKELTDVYWSLTDDNSRKALLAYINQKISMDYKYLKSVRSEVQYFDPELVQLSSNEILVDAGAYIGDTVLSFISALKRLGIDKWEAIYSFEPNPSNYKKLAALNVENLETFMLATSDHRSEKVSFASIGKGASSVIIGNDDEDNIQIKSDLIDDVLAGKKVTFIKMDVEGYELASLRGAKKIIEKQRPTLAICIYHKRCDLWEIQNYIKSVVNDYKFYIRSYEDTATELVLYALPF